ncbi:hypothetical protein POM88_025588 [Heracleum sosnowskyi]|uniref:Uncharacterized protein n=1 Tax=Heracleum sosnowskyi TaxID=360622 RepID=A0AAD8MNA5_9APIA|nr:hypothetical protein POM88_025588 [Heracleum sosnowskyi]
MDKSSTTLLMLIASSSVVLTLFVCIGIYISNQPLFQIIWFYSSSHPLLALNLLILLIIVSSRCFAISRNNNSIDYRDDRDQLLLSSDSTQRIIPLIPSLEDASTERERVTSKTRKEGTLERTRKTTKEGTHLRQLKHSNITTEDTVRPPEMSTECRNDEVTSSASSSLSSAKLRKEVSLTKEEVNRRVERFIRKFND